MATQFERAQLEDGIINNVKVAAGAGIITTKLADGAEFIQRGGSVAFTADQPFGNHKITGLATGIANDEAVNVGQLNSAITAALSPFQSKGTVRVASTANVTISGPGAAIDGVTLANGDRVLLKSQSTASQNGIYVFNGAVSAMTRATDMDAWDEVPGAWVTVQEGTTNADTLWLSTANTGGTLGTTSITFTAIPTTGLTSSNFVDKETPSGTINSSNTAFTLANTPVAGSVHLYYNGQLWDEGDDYTISGANITAIVVPATGKKLRASYRK